MKPLLRAVRRTGNRLSAGALEGLVGIKAALSPSLREAPRPPRSIFVLRNNDVGDLLVVTPLFEALRRCFPEAWIAAGVGDWNRGVVEGNPHLSEVLSVNAPWFNKYREAAGPLGRLAYIRSSPEVRRIAEHGFEVGIDVLGSAWGSLLMLQAKIPYRLGMRGYAGGYSAAQAAVRFDPAENVGRSALRFAELLGADDLPPNRPQLFLRDEEREEGERWWQAAEGDRRRRRVIVGPGGGLATKCWPGDRFAALAAGLATHEDLSLLVLGGRSEEAMVAGVAAAAPGARTFPEPPGLRQVFALVAAADLVVCNSSMLIHAAAAFAKPAVVVLGAAFSSASAHQAQWGYPGLSISLGLCTPEEALDAVRRKLAGG